MTTAPPIRQCLVRFAPAPDALTIVRNGRAAPLCLAAEEPPGVLRATRDLQADVERVSSVRPRLLTGAPGSARHVVIIGTLDQSGLLARLVDAGKLDPRGVSGRWESFLLEVVSSPLPGIERALVIAGSDRRGTIYGIYELSRQIGVSPWYWWADVPVARHAEIVAHPGRRVEGEPAVRYRGIFLNDEAPALSGWAREKFGGFNHHFYERVFELLLRLRANCLWPAMWSSAFNEDDPLNPRLADEYGIVMGTSHHEPMLRAQQEWKRHGRGPWDYATNADVLRDFWTEGIGRNRDYESFITLGMRGDGDLPMSEQEDIPQRCASAPPHAREESHGALLLDMLSTQGTYERSRSRDASIVPQVLEPTRIGHSLRRQRVDFGPKHRDQPLELIEASSRLLRPLKPSA